MGRRLASRLSPEERDALAPWIDAGYRLIDLLLDDDGWLGAVLSGDVWVRIRSHGP